MTDTEPMIFHNAGGPTPLVGHRGSEYWNLIKDQLFKNRRKRNCSKNSGSLEIITCNNFAVEPIVVRCLKYLGFENYKEIKLDHTKEWRFLNKLTKTFEYLTTESTSEFVMFLDSSDVILVDDPEIALSRYLDYFDCAALFNAERIPWPNTAMDTRSSLPLFLKGKNSETIDSALQVYSEFRLDQSDMGIVEQIEEFEIGSAETEICHLNSGCYMGRKDFIIEMISLALSYDGHMNSQQFRNSDQILMRLAYRDLWPSVRVDDRCRIFQCMLLSTPEEYMSIYADAFARSNSKLYALMYKLRLA